MHVSFLKSVRLYAHDLGIRFLEYGVHGQRASILMYHSIGTDDAFFTVTPEAFRLQMDYLHQAGFHVMSLASLVWSLRQHQPIPPKTVALTFDDGYLDNYTEAWPILAAHELPFTIFVATGTIGGTRTDARGRTRAMMGKDHLLELHASGLVDIEPHTVSHPHLTRVSSEEVQRELVESKEMLEHLLGVPRRLFAYPFGDYDERVAKIAGEYFDAAVTVRPGFISHASSLISLSRNSVDAAVTMRRFRAKT